MSEVCQAGCRTRADKTGRRFPVEAAEPARLCRACVDRLEKYLGALADLAYLLPDVVMPGTVDANPEGHRARRVDPPAPLRLAVVDALDVRPIRRHGEALAAMLAARTGAPVHVTGHYRGAAGLLESWARWVREERGLDAPDRATVDSEQRLLWQHRHWIVRQEWVAYRMPGAVYVEGFYPEIRQLHHVLADTVGAYRPRPVGRCHVQVRPGVECRGPILPDDDDDGVHCPRCGTHWPWERLNHLGLIIERPPTTATTGA